MIKYALLLGLGAVSFVSHAQVSGKTASLNSADYDSPADTSRLRLPPGVLRDELLSIPHGADPSGDAEPDALFWEDDVAVTPDSTSLDADARLLTDQSDESTARDDRLWSTAWQMPGAEESGTSDDAALRIDENAHLGEPWQYVGWRERQFLHIRFTYIDWLAQLNGTGTPDSEPPASASEAEDWTTVGLEESAFLVIGKTSDVPEQLSERQDYLAGWEWYFREEDGPEESGNDFGNTAVVAQGWRTFADEYGLLRLPGTTIEQQGDDQFAQVIQRESGGVVRISQQGDANATYLTQTTGDSSVEVTQLGVNNTVTTTQSTIGSLAVVRQLGIGQILHLEQAPDPEGQGRTNGAFLRQTGSGNAFTGTQTGSENLLTGPEGTADQSGLANLTRLEQEGDGNVLLLRQEGENQRTTVIQSGDKNKAVIFQSRVP